MRTWTRGMYAAARFMSGTFVCALSLGFTMQAHASPAQVLPGSVQAPFPGPNTGFQVNLREQHRVTGSAPVVIVDAQLLMNGEVTQRFPVGASGMCVTVGAAPITGADTFALQVTFANQDGRAVGTFPLTNSPAPPIQDRSCSYPNTAPTNVDFEYDIQRYDPELGTQVLLTGSATDAENDELTFEWEVGPRIREGQQTTVFLPEGETLVLLRVRDRGQLTAESRQLINIPPVGGRPNVELGDTIRLTDNGAAGELVEITPTITGGDPVSYQWFVGDRLVSREPTFSETLNPGDYLVSVSVMFTDEQTYGDEVRVIIDRPANQPPTADASLTQTTYRDDDTPGVAVTLNGRASTDSDGQIASYTWTVGTNPPVTVQTPEHVVTLLPGQHTVVLRVTDDDGAVSAPVSIAITVQPGNAPPTANAGPDRNVPDNDGNEGESSVPLNGSASIDPEGGPLTYSWTNAQGVEIGTGPTPNVRLLSDGPNVVTLIVRDNEQRASQPDSVTITVAAPQDVISRAGPDQITNDDDGIAGDFVNLDGSGSSGPGITYQWLLGENLLGTTPTLRVRLDDGVNDVTLAVTDRFQRSSRDSVRITVRARPTANAGSSRTVPDSDGVPGELVTLSGSATDRDGQIVTYQWYDGEQALTPTGAQITPRLTDGVHTIRLVVTDNSGLTDDATIQIAVTQPNVPDPQPPTVSAGEPQNVRDTDGVAGENVNLTGTATDPQGGPLTYRWVLQNGSEGGEEIGTTLALTRRLPDGRNNLALEVTDNTELTARAEVVVTVGAPQTPTVNAGVDQSVPDRDGTDGETVTLTGTATDGDGAIASYTWLLGEQELGRGATFNARIPNGVHTVTLRVRDTQGLEASDTVQISVAAAARAPTANAGADQSIADRDGTPGELVQLTGTATDPDENIASYRWSLGETTLGTTATLQAPLPDGVSVVSLTVTDTTGLSATDTVQITIAAPQLPVVDAGISQTLDDTDVQSGEMVTLSGSATGTIARFDWLLGDVSLGTGQTIRVRLPDGVNLVTLRATNAANLTGSATVRISVAVGVRTVLSNIPGLTENEKRLAQGLDEACNNILGPLTSVEEAPPTDGEGALLTKAARPPTEEETSDFAQKCRGLLISRNNAQLKGAMGALLGDDFAAARTQTLLFANTQYASVMDRLIALRGGARGLSLAGLNIMVDGEMIPLASLQGLAKQLFGGGASSDADGGLWSDKWGLWARGNYSFGSKNDDRLSPSFEADQYALLAGLDYRLTETAVVGGALAYGNSSVDFNDNDGSLDTESWALSLYGSLYAKRNFYFDAIVNVADSGYTAERNIAYVDGYGLVDADADGDTGGLTLSGGMSGGYDFLIGGLTISPTIGAFYIDAQIDEFTESGASGLNLIYDEQQFKSMTGTLGVRMTFSWNLPFGVVLPHFRADFVREFEDDVDVFGIRFAADPNAPSAPPILIETENADSSYWRLAAGVSAQFRHGISGYVEYQRLESFRFISFQDVSVGLRFQAAF